MGVTDSHSVSVSVGNRSGRIRWREPRAAQGSWRLVKMSRLKRIVVLAAVVLGSLPSHLLAAPPSLGNASVTRLDGSAVRRLYPSEHRVQARVAVDDPGEETKVQVVLWAVDAGGYKNRRLIGQGANVPKPTTGNRSELTFTFTMARDWPAGSYRMDFQLERQGMVQRTFVVPGRESMSAKSGKTTSDKPSMTTGAGATKPATPKTGAMNAPAPNTAPAAKP